MYYIKPYHPPKILWLTWPTTHSFTAAVLTLLSGLEPNPRLSEVPRGTENTHTQTHKLQVQVSVNMLRSDLALCQESLRRILATKANRLSAVQRDLKCLTKDGAGKGFVPESRLRRCSQQGGAVTLQTLHCRVGT